MNKQLIVAILVLLAFTLGVVFLNSRNQIDQGGYTGGVACTMEAKLCPDGSYVGRGGPNCEFANCPSQVVKPVVPPAPVETTKTTGTLTGVVTLGPTCPVERMPPDPQCAPRPYAVFVDIVRAGLDSIYKTVETDVGGKFTVQLPPGSYELHMRNKTASTFPRCETAIVQVEKGKTVDSPISCDTGIR